MQHGTFYYFTTPTNGQAPHGVICFRLPKITTTALEITKCTETLGSVIRRLRKNTVKRLSLRFTQGNQSYTVFGTVNDAPADKDTLLQAIEAILQAHNYYVDDISSVLAEVAPPVKVASEQVPLLETRLASNGRIISYADTASNIPYMRNAW